MSSALDFQAWRPAAMRDGPSPDSRAKSTGGTVVALAKLPAASPGWDPYEVWLTRVKQPREKTKRDSAP